MALDFAGRPVVVAGGGAVATRKVRALLEDDAQVHVVAPDVSREITDWSHVGRVTVSPRPVAEHDLDEVWLAIAATNDPAINDAVARWAEERHVWCVNASAAAAGSARSVTQETHAGLVIGVASGGGPDPARARAALLALVSALNEGHVPLRAQRGHTGKVILIGAGPGAADLVTIRASRALASADVVVHDRLGTEELLASVPDDVERIDVGKQPDNHPVSQERINELLVEHARQGKTVARLKGGDPFVFGRGGEEVIACAQAGVDVEVVPGVTSAIAAPSAGGIPVTHRGVSAAVHISAAHEGLDDAALAAMLHGATVVLLMGVRSLSQSVERALGEGVDPQLPVAIVENGTLPQQRVTRAALRDIVQVAADAGVKSPAVIVMGEVARPGLLT